MRVGRRLRSARLSIDPESPTIGTYERLPERLGRPVTQEEAAESLGVSREWYSKLENGALTGISAELARRIRDTFSIPAHILLRRQSDEQLRSDMLEGFAELRGFVKRITCASSFDQAVHLGVQASERIVQPDCATIASLEDDERVRGCAAGVRSQYWSSLSDVIALEAHAAALRDGGVSVAPYVPLPSEVQADANASMSFDKIDEDAGYRYECDLERWQRFNGRLGLRSAVIVPLFETNSFGGIIATLWAYPHSTQARAADVAETIAGIVRLASIAAEREVPASQT